MFTELRQARGLIQTALSSTQVAIEESIALGFGDEAKDNIARNIRAAQDKEYLKSLGVLPTDKPADNTQADNTQPAS